MDEQRVRLVAKEVVATTMAKGGASVSIEGYRPPEDGWMVSLPGAERKVSIGDFNELEVLVYINDFEYILSQPRHYVGAWQEGDTIYLDVSEHCAGRDEAIQAGLRRQQKAIYDLSEGKVYWL